MPRRRDDRPFRIVSIRQIPCEDVGAVYRAAWDRILNCAAARQLDLAMVAAEQEDHETGEEGRCDADA